MLFGLLPEYHEYRHRSTLVILQKPFDTAIRTTVLFVSRERNDDVSDLVRHRIRKRA